MTEEGQQTSENTGKEPADESSLTDEEMRARLLQLAFAGDAERLREFCQTVEDSIPAGTCVMLRGSAITGTRWKDGAPFDADGPGTSDLDLTLVGDDIIDLYHLDGFYVPLIHSKPLSDKDPDIAPDLVPLRERLQQMVGRPVNIQATRDFVMTLRGDIIGQPYLTLIDKAKDK